MTPLYLASIAGLPVGLFHDPGPTLAAQYGPPPQMVTYSQILWDIDRMVEADMCFDEEDCPPHLEFVAP